MRTRLPVAYAAMVLLALAVACGQATPRPSEPAEPTVAPTATQAGGALSEAQAREIAANSACAQEGALRDTAIYNDSTGTWWIDLDVVREGCAPACVVNVRTRAAEVNWRCTGLIVPEEAGEAGPPVDASPAPLAVPDAVAVSYGGVAFSYSASLATSIVAESVPAVAADQDAPEWEIVPEHLVFTFQGYTLPGAFHTPRIYVFPAADFEARSPVAETMVPVLRDLLAERPVAPARLPILPPMNAGQLMNAQLAYVDFTNGSGVRYLTQLGQAYAPINSTDLIYTYQGLTSDGQFYVAVVLPVSHPSLPADASQIPGGDMDALAADFEQYAAGVAAALDAQAASSFAPDLALLDALVASLEISPAVSEP